MTIQYPCVCVIICVAFLIIICLQCTEGFEMSRENKVRVAKQLVKGEPTYDKFRSHGLDGAHYYDAHQLWTSKQYSVPNIVNLIK
jgi:hypothetical protein